MKNNLQTNPLLFKLIILVTCFMLVMLYNKSKASSIVGNNNELLKKEILIKHSQLSLR